jgi:hypothetical protein
METNPKPKTIGEITMADYTMDDEKWNSRVALVTSHMEENDLGDATPVIQYNLSQGTKQPEFRKRFWSNITNLFATMENSPITIGPKSSLPQVVQESIKTICAVYAEGHTVLFASHPLYGELERKRGKANYAQYDDAGSYGEQKAKNVKTRLTAYYRNHVNNVADEISWDGTVNKNGMPSLTLPAQGGDE